jgi:hypothetical protein
MTATTIDIAAPASTGTGTCTRCHRMLKDPKSVERGRGPVCERKYRAAVEEAAKLTSEAQVDKAVLLLAAGGVAKNSQDSFYTVTTGNGFYRTDRTSCTCHAGQNGRTCYHLVAVCLVELKAVKLQA